MKVLLALTTFALILTAACSIGDAATTTTTTCANPNDPPGPAVSPLADVPEGTLLLARELPKSILTLDGKCGEVTVLPNANQTWPAPDGSKSTVILGSGQSNTGIAVIDGDGMHTLTEWDRNAGFWPTVVWSGDSERVAYNRPGSSEEPAGVWAWDGQESRRVYKGAEAWPIGFTSDGNVVLSPSMKRLKVVDQNGAELQSVEMPFDDFSTGYIVSPDGRKLAVMSEADGGGAGPYSTGLWLYDFGSQEWPRLAEMGASVSSSPGAVQFVSSNWMVAAKARKGTPPPTWSADSERLTYYRVYTAAKVYHAELWLYDLASGTDEMLSDSGWNGGWSPDGEYYAFQKGSPESIGLLEPDGEVETLERGKGFSGMFDWTPDGRLLISSGHDLRLYDPGTRETEELEYDGKPIGGVAVYPDSIHASPSGRYFAVATSFDSGGGSGFSYGNINPGVYIIDTQTGEATRVIDKSGVYMSGWLEE